MMIILAQMSNCKPEIFIISTLGPLAGIDPTYAYAMLVQCSD